MSKELTARFSSALETFVAKASQDKYVLAIILAGSLYHDVVWEKSDIDVILIIEDTKSPLKSLSLVEDGIIINAYSFNRREFKRNFESALRSSQFHSWLSQTKLLFTRDETLSELFEAMSEIGDSDREMLLLQHATLAIADLIKAEKFLVVKQDPLLSYHWAMRSITSLATIEVLLQGHIPLRDVLPQALDFRPALFNPLFVELSHQAKSTDLMKRVLAMVRDYLREHTSQLFKPILSILAEAGATTGLSIIHERISLTLQLPVALLVESCEWLVEQGIIEKLSSPIELTTKSRALVEEVAYYYDGRGLGD